MSTSSGSSTQRATGTYFLVIEGLPRRYTWQNLKDLIRQQAAHNCWTDMAVFPNGHNGKGHARVAKADEAKKLYKYLVQTRVENNPLVVHMWDITGAIPMFIRCNCGGTSELHRSNGESARVSAMAHNPGWQRCLPMSPLAPINCPHPMMQAQAQAGAMSSPFVAPVPRANISADHTQLANAMSRAQLSSRDASQTQPAQYTMFQPRQAQQYQQYPPQQRQPTQMPMYAANATGTPINISQGIVRTECRGIFVNGLSYKARTKDIEKRFGQAGQIIKVEHQKASQSGRSKGNCTIQYANAESVSKAIAMFHGQMFMGMVLNVRRDKEATPVDAPATTDNVRSRAGKTITEPIIVNGSQTRKDSVLSFR